MSASSLKSKCDDRELTGTEQRSLLLTSRFVSFEGRGRKTEPGDCSILCRLGKTVKKMDDPLA